jgi:outer membrane protein
LRTRLAIALIAGTVSPAIAQDRTADEGWGLVVGAGALSSPTDEGDDASRLSILPNLQVTYSDKFFASVQEGIGYRVIADDTLKAGPILRVKFSRSEDGDQPFAIEGDDTTDLRGLGDVDTSLEAGGFVDYKLGPVTFSAEARQAFTGHEGFVADVGVKWSGRNFMFGPPIIWSVGPRARFVDDTYNSAYFGVTPTQSLASGLPVFDAAGGLHSYGLGATAIIPLTQDKAWAAVIVAGYDRLSGDAADNPLVQLRGSEDQASLGVFLSYRAF